MPMSITSSLSVPMRRVRAFSLSSLVPVAAFLAACSGGGDGPTGGGQQTPTVATVTVTGTASLETGKTTVLTARALDATGTAISGKAFSWSSSADAVASVASDGTVTAKTTGAATISASVDGKTGSLAVTVTAPVSGVSSVVVSGTPTLQAGATTKLSATINSVTGGTLSLPVTWSSSDNTMMTVASDGTVSALRIGTVTITASAGGTSGSLVVTSSLAPYTFNFPSGTSSDDAQMIKDLVQFGTAYFQTTFGRTITTPTTVSGVTGGAGCDARAGNAAFTGAGQVTFCVANQGWTVQGPISKQKIVVHELFHVWQFQYGWLTKPQPGPAWIIEGSAELVGYLGVDAKGLLPLSTTRGCVVKEVTDFAKQQPPGLPPLSAVESAQAFQSTIGPLYSLSLTAMDYLTAGTGAGVLSLKTYTDAVAAGQAPTAAFQAAFNTSLSTFYAQFPTYYNTLPIPAQYLCRV